MCGFGRKSLRRSIPHPKTKRSFPLNLPVPLLRIGFALITINPSFSFSASRTRNHLGKILRYTTSTARLFIKDDFIDLQCDHAPGGRTVAMLL